MPSWWSLLNSQPGIRDPQANEHIICEERAPHQCRSSLVADDNCHLRGESLAKLVFGVLVRSNAPIQLQVQIIFLSLTCVKACLQQLSSQAAWNGCRGRAVAVVRLPFVLVFRQRCTTGTGALRCQTCSVTYRSNELRGRGRGATQMQQSGGVSILAPLSGSLN